MSKRAHEFVNLVVGDGFVTEGSARISFPKGEVFYNPVQQFNRDLSISVISVFQKLFLAERKSMNKKSDKTGISIMEALSATGLRSIRYAKEIRNVEEIIANDLDPEAVNLIRKNVADNFGEGSVIAPNCADAIYALYSYKSSGKSFDVVDLDPYGSAAPFLDASIANITDGGLLCVTCTDTAVLCASYSESCFSKYGSVPLKGEVSHEMALRIVLSTIDSTASRHKKYIVPLLSCSIDFYVRFFVRIYSSPAESKKSCIRQSHAFRCVGCKSIELEPLMVLNVNGNSQKYSNSRLKSDSACKICGSRIEIAGPIWNGKLHDVEFIEQLLSELPNCSAHFGTLPRIEGLVSLCREELETPLYISLNEAASIVKSSCPPLVAFRSGLLNLGFCVSISHCNPKSIKTNAPHSVFWSVMKDWLLQNKSIAIDQLPNDSIAQRVLNSVPSLNTCFEIHKDANPPSRKAKMCRFPENPVENWGPLAKANSSKIRKLEQTEK